MSSMFGKSYRSLSHFIWNLLGTDTMNQAEVESFNNRWIGAAAGAIHGNYASRGAVYIGDCQCDIMFI